MPERDGPTDFLAQIVPQFRKRVREVRYDKETASLAEQIHVYLKRKSYDVDTNDRIQLQAASLLSEYFDANGEYQKASVVVQRAAPNLLKNLDGWKVEIGCPETDRKLFRQRVWCLLDWSYNHYRNGKLSEAESILERVHHFVTLKLADPVTFPAHGTLYLIWYLLGLIRRDLGKLDSAGVAFRNAIRFAKERNDRKVQKYTGLDEHRVRREKVWFEMCQARTLAFGFAEVEFYRGNFYQAEALFTAAESLLREGGLERWRRAICVYKLGCSILTAELTDRSATRLKQVADDLLRSSAELKSQHPQYSKLAAAFRLAALVRHDQLTAAKETDMRNLMMFGSSGCLAQQAREREAAERSGGRGAIGGLIARIEAEALLRCGLLDEAIASMEHSERLYKSYGWFSAEFALLTAEAFYLRDDPSQARRQLRKIPTLAPNRQQTIWAQLLEALATGRTPPELVTRDVIENIEDAYVRALLSCISQADRGAILREYPFHARDGVSPNFDVDANLHVLELEILQSAIAAYPNASREEVAHLCNRSPSWVYDRLSHGKDLDWVKQYRRRTERTPKLK